MDCWMSISLPRVKKSVCGCSLFTGTINIAWFQTIGGIIVTFVSLISLIRENEDASKQKQPESGIIATYIVYGLCQFVLGIILLLSVKWKLLDFVNVWVIISIITIGIYIGVLLGQTIVLLVGGLFNIGAILFCSGILAIGHSFYCTVVVSSFHKEAKAAGGSF